MIGTGLVLTFHPVRYSARGEQSCGRSLAGRKAPASLKQQRRLAGRCRCCCGLQAVAATARALQGAPPASLHMAMALVTLLPPLPMPAQNRTHKTGRTPLLGLGLLAVIDHDVKGRPQALVAAQPKPAAPCRQHVAHAACRGGGAGREREEAAAGQAGGPASSLGPEAVPTPAHRLGTCSALLTTLPLRRGSATVPPPIPPLKATATTTRGHYTAASSVHPS